MGRDHPSRGTAARRHQRRGAAAPRRAERHVLVRTYAAGVVAGLSLAVGVAFLVLGRLLKEPWKPAKDGEDTVFRNFFHWGGVLFIVGGLLRLLF